MKLTIVEHCTTENFLDCRLILIRGCDGSGKGTLATSIHDRALWHPEKGNKKFQRLSLRNAEQSASCMLEAEQQLLRQTYMELAKGESVIVTHHFTTLASLLPYVELAEGKQLPFAVLRCFGIHKTSREVPRHLIVSQVQQYQPLQGTLNGAPRSHLRWERDSYKTSAVLREELAAMDSVYGVASEWAAAERAK